MRVRFRIPPGRSLHAEGRHSREQGLGDSSSVPRVPGLGCDGSALEMHKLPADGGGVTRLQEIAASYCK